MLQVDNVSFAYDAAEVLHDVTFTVTPGMLLGILGPNGSGKTTLLRLLAGARVPTRGTVRAQGVDLRQMPRRDVARRLAVVPQETHLAFDYTVLELALMGRYPHLGTFQIEGPADLDIALAALRTTGTEAFAGRSFDSLSGGEKQRVVIAGAIAQLAPVREPQASGAPEEGGWEALLLDEPTASLDLGYQLEIAALLRRLNDTRGLTIVLSTHDLNFAASLCRELILLREGRILAAGPTERVLTPEHVSALYDVEADVHMHERSGHLAVMPIRRS